MEMRVWGIRKSVIKGKESMGDYNFWDWKEQRVWGIRISGIEMKGEYWGLEYLGLNEKEGIGD